MKLTDYIAQVVIQIPLIVAGLGGLIVVLVGRRVPRAAKLLAGFGCAAILLTELTWMAWGLSANWLISTTGIAPDSMNLIFYAVDITLNCFTAIGICLLVAALWTAARQSPASPAVPSTGSPLAPTSTPPTPFTATPPYPASASAPPSTGAAYPPAPGGDPRADRGLHRDQPEHPAEIPVTGKG